MLKHKKIKIGGAPVLALQLDLGAKRLIVLKARRGYLMCGYLNLGAAGKFRDAAAKISAVATIEEALKAKIASCTPAARKLGLKPGQPVRAALRALS